MTTRHESARTGTCLAQQAGACQAVRPAVLDVHTVDPGAGMIQPTSGNAVINGMSIRAHMGAIRQDLGVCPQFDILWPNITVRQLLLQTSSRRRLMCSLTVPCRMSLCLLPIAVPSARCHTAPCHSCFARQALAEDVVRHSLTLVRRCCAPLFSPWCATLAPTSSSARSGVWMRCVTHLHDQLPGHWPDPYFAVGLDITPF